MTIMKEFPAAPIHSIPTSDATRKALLVLSDGKPHPKIVFIEAIGDDPRSLKQAQRESARLPRAIDTAIKVRCEDQQGFDFDNTKSGPSATNDKGHNLAGISLDKNQDSISIVVSNPNLQKGVQHAD
ncbi:hypothetical protein Q4583_16820 [Neptunomonas phycophila]|uniref:hypothetical protein n=1 Tax=Neptunomonas phycophila TaxID=1572645 RepID=UPI0026E266A8|nr:hypothetical protein [Neptunomonas phycophila]MDO6785779.1 hypothetical protein [Neptunomonas phycophila]